MCYDGTKLPNPCVVLCGRVPNSAEFLEDIRYSAVADKITRDRFGDMTRYLHNATLAPSGYDRLGKVRPVINHLSSDLYEPH